MSIKQTPYAIHQNKVPQAMTMLAVCIGYFMVILDTTIVTVALPSIQQGLRANVAELQWITDGYILVFASLLLTFGSLCDRLGAKRVFLLGQIIFAAASGFCGLAPTIELLLVARIVQGIGAAMLVPATLSLLNEAYPGAIARARAIAIWAAIAGSAQAIGPVVGGALAETLGWRSIFFVNILLGVVGVVLTFYAMRSSPLPGQGKFHLSEPLVAIIILAALTTALIEGQTAGWGSLFVLGSCGLCLVASFIFIILERHIQNPMLPLKLFRDPTFSATVAAGSLLNFSYYGQIFILSLVLQQVWHYSALMTGLAFLPMASMVAIVPALVGRFASHWSPRSLIAAGMVSGGLGSLALILVTPATNVFLIELLLLAIGAGVGLAGPPLATALLAHTPTGRAGIASGVLNTSRQVGSVLGVALLGGFVNKDQTIALVGGLHVAVGIAGVLFLVGYVIIMRYAEKRQQAKLEKSAVKPLPHVTRF